MDPSDFPTGRPSPPRKELQLQGPRPAPLKVHKDSRKIKKPPLAPQASQHLLPPQPQPPPQPPQPPEPQQRQPVIIYTVSPKVIHTTASDFMTLVQRLTGPNSSPTTVSSSSSSSYIDASGANVVVSPAARFATIEKANNSNSPTELEKSRKKTSELELEGLEINNGGATTVERTTGGILSPLPSSLPPISPSFFSPTLPDPNSLGFMQDLSPMFQFNRNYIEGTLVPSPTAAFFSSATLPSPTPYMDLFNNFDFDRDRQWD